MTCLRAIVDKVICNDWYKNIDENMSDSNVGGKHNRGIRDILFILTNLWTFYKKIFILKMKFSIRKCKNATNICLWYSKWPHGTHKRNPKKNKRIKVKRLRYLQKSVKNNLFWPKCHIMEASEFLFSQKI